MLSFFIRQRLSRWNRSVQEPVASQKALFAYLLSKGAATRFGHQHNFDKIRSLRDYRERVPLRDYDAYAPFIQRIQAGEAHVLWPGRPLYFAKSSGTVASVKYLPVTAEGARTYTTGGLDLLSTYALRKNDPGILLGQKIFIQGSPELEWINGIRTGRMSGVSYHLVPWVLKSFQSPTYATNILKDWEEKVRRIAAETKGQNLRIIAGIPPWVMMYLDELRAQTGHTRISDIFPRLSLYIHGGVNFEPYRPLILEKMGGPIDTLDTYTASEGFMGFQELGETGMTLCCNNGIFYEFVPVKDMETGIPTRLSLEEVETGQDYALVLNTVSGLWSYVIGDTIRFVSLRPYRFVVTGRVAEFTSLFGEHVIEEEVRRAMQEVSAAFDLKVRYYTVAPYLVAAQGLSCHEWWIEFEQPPDNTGAIAVALDAAICRQNPYYKDLTDGNILQCAKVVAVAPDGFRQCLRASGKMDGQNKISLLSNHRKWAEALEPYKVGKDIGL